MMNKILWAALMLASPLAMANDGVSAVPPTGTEAQTPFERDFRQTDANHDDVISREEAEQAKAQILIANFDKIDINSNGTLDKAEVKSFLQTAIQSALRAQQEEFLRRLKAADKNGNGGLTKKELAAAKDKLPGVEKNFDAIDANHDKQITMQEILAFARANQPQ